ncbi:MAG TPA: translation initiation factor IF-2, partial [Clostridiales bacterium]|nr:translation initiation factor IF-2 [Clostridiales bacterium]
MAIKVKINELSKDLNVTNQELIDVLFQYDEDKRKPTSTLTKEELDFILDKYSQNNQVASFDEYFATKSQKKDEVKTESKNVAKDTDKVKENPLPKVKEAVKAEQKKENAPKPVNNNANSARPVNNNANTARPVNKNANTARPVNNNANAAKPVKSQQKANNVSKFDHVKQKAKENILSGNKSNKPKPVNANTPRPQNTSGKTKLNANIAGEAVVEKSRTVDTRGTYVELEKYNERYEKIAPHPGRGKENYSRKQKINQRSARRNKQQYSNKQETEGEKLRRLELERARKQQLKVKIPDTITVGELASRLKVNAAQVIKRLMGLDIMASISEEIDYDTACLVAEELGAKVEKEVIVTIEERLIKEEEDDTANLVERDPVVVVMGHVDHGKTSLLDRIRNAEVTASEAGGITQHIGAYRVSLNDKKITFLDTPGHEAFTSMRARGASITDIAILVVAADDGIMPQTVEAINHARAAEVSIIVAINKMDKEAANPDKIKQELTEHGLVIEEWGGDIICVPVSAKTGEGIDELLENVSLVAEMKELKANPDRQAKGAVIEARLDKGRGPIATVLIQNGTLHTGDVIIAG